MENIKIMQTIKIFVLSMAIGSSAFASELQRGDEIYLDVRMEIVKNKKQATYICSHEGMSELGHNFKVYFITGELKMEGYYLDEAMEKPHGEFKYYYRSGQLECVGEYRDGQKYGIWLRYDEKGNPKPEKVYASQQMLNALATAKQEREK